MNCIKMRGTGHYGDTIYKCDISVGCDMHFVRDMFLRNVNVSPMDLLGFAPSTFGGCVSHIFPRNFSYVLFRSFLL